MIIESCFLLMMRQYCCYCLQSTLIKLSSMKVYWMSFFEELAQKHWLFVSLSDTGVGISSDNMKSLFQPYVYDKHKNQQVQTNNIRRAAKRTGNRSRIGYFEEYHWSAWWIYCCYFSSWCCIYPYVYGINLYREVHFAFGFHFYPKKIRPMMLL